MSRRTLGALLGLLPTLALAPAATARTAAEPAQNSRALAVDVLRASSARSGQQLRMHEGPYGTPRYLSGALSGPRARGVSFEAQARAFLSAQHTLFPVAADQLVLDRAVTDRTGGQHLRFQQVYEGVKVFNATLVVHLDRDGRVEAVNGTAVADLRLDVRPALLPEDIYELVNDLLFPNLWDLHDASLVVYPTRAGSTLAYQVPVMLEQGPRVLFLDANSGDLIWSENPLRDASTTGTGVDVLGNQVTNLKMFKGRFFQVDVSPLFSVYIQNASKGAYNLVDKTTPDLGEIYTFTSNDTYLMDVDYLSSPDSSFDDPKSNDDPSGVSAHVGFRKTLDFYKARFNRNGIDGQGLNVSGVVEVNGIPGYPLECNAGWLGYGYNFMMFGMGGDCGAWGEMYPFSAGLDVIGHELNHGVDEFTINLGYNHEAGALNEHLADVFGMLLEHHDGDTNWLIGEALPINPVPPFDAFRSLENPPAYYVTSTVVQPDKMVDYYAAPVSYDAGGVHFNSGIPNKAFYLTVVGGSFNGVTVTPFSTDLKTSLKMGGDIWYDVMNSMRISNVSQFIDLRDALTAATQKLYPSSVNTITQAFTAVGVVNDMYPTSSQDLKEPNEYPGLAIPIAIGGTSSQLIWDRNDTDIYKIDLNASQSIKVTLSKLAFDGMLTIYSVGPYSTLTRQVESNNTGTADETVTFAPTAGGSFYIEVMPNNNRGSRTAPYTLTVVKP